MRQPELWASMSSQAQALHRREPALRPLLERTVLHADGLPQALVRLLAPKLGTADVDATLLGSTMDALSAATPTIVEAAGRDLVAIVERDPCTDTALRAFLFHKGFHALQVHRMGHALWLAGRPELAGFLQNRMSDVFAVDIHPAARIGAGVFIDHATGVVIGETASVGDDVTILQDVTLGGTGKQRGDRHPKVGDRVLLCAGAKVLGNVRVGDGARVGAGSVVLDHVAPFTTMVGVPARAVRRAIDQPADAALRRPARDDERVEAPANSLEDLA
jgi:serine O-acetyltransferase